MTVPLSDIAEAAGAPLAAVEQALAIVQGLEPPGVRRPLRWPNASRFQAKAADRYDQAMARLIDDLDLLSKARAGDLERIYGEVDEDLTDMIRELRAYDPEARLARFSWPARPRT